MLLRQCRDGRQAAWRELVRRYQRLVFAIARRAGLDEHGAADVLQATCSRLYEHLPRLQQPDRLQAWIVTTARRETLAQLRLSSRFVSTSGDDGGDLLEQVADESPIAQQVLEDLQQAQQMRLAFDRLDERCRRLLERLFGDEDERADYAALSSQLGMPVGSIGPTRGRCLGKLRQLYAQVQERGS